MLAMLMLLATIQGDTTVAVTKGARLDVSLHNGSVTVRAWNRDAVQVTSDDDRTPRVNLSAGSVSVGPSGRYGTGSADLVINAPAWMSLSINGVGLDITVDGMKGGANLETVQGDVELRNAEGTLTLESVEGSVTIENATGRVDASSVNDDVLLTNIAGEIRAESTNGDVRLEKIRSASVEASTINGDITFDGPVREGGRYALSTHDGDLWMTVPEGSSATVSVSTFSGSFESDFPVSLERGQRTKRRFTFVLGGGSARVDLESFSGDVRLVRPGGRGSSMEHGKNKDKDHDEN